MAELWRGRRPRQRARRRLGLEGRAARRSRSCSSSGARRGLPFDRPSRRLARARLRRASSSSTRCSRRAGSTAARRTRACCSASRHDLLPVARVLPRPRARPDASRARAGSVDRDLLTAARRSPPSGWSTSTRSRSRGGATRRARLVQRAARVHATRASRACPRTSSTTRATASSSGGSSRRSSRRSRPRTCSWSRCCFVPLRGRRWGRAARPCAALRRAALDALALVPARARRRSARARRVCGRARASRSGAAVAVAVARLRRS